MLIQFGEIHHPKAIWRALKGCNKPEEFNLMKIFMARCRFYDNFSFAECDVCDFDVRMEKFRELCETKMFTESTLMMIEEWEEWDAAPHTRSM